MAFTASSAPCERIFSSGSLTITAKRHRLNADVASAQITAGQNKRFRKYLDRRDFDQSVAKRRKIVSLDDDAPSTSILEFSTDH